MFQVGSAFRPFTTTVTTVVSSPPHSSAQNNEGEPNSLPQPTVADVEFDQWCDRQGIVRAGVQTITARQSAGGRGLFATQFGKSGSVVASIPASLVMVADDDDDEDGTEWQVSLTKRVSTTSSNTEQNPWIESWSSPPDVASLLSVATEDERSDDGTIGSSIDGFVRNMVGRGNVTEEGARTAVKGRLETYERRFDENVRATSSDLPKWYALVMSRAAYLGKSWNYRIGIVPFFDMLNHSHDATEANVDLTSFGDCLDRAGENVDLSEISLDRKDMLLVLNKDVARGQELLTQYETDVQDERTQLKLWIQYGIPPPE